MGGHRGGRKNSKRSSVSPVRNVAKKPKQARQREAPTSPEPSEDGCISGDSFICNSTSTSSIKSTTPTPQVIQQERIPPIIVHPSL